MRSRERSRGDSRLNRQNDTRIRQRPVSPIRNRNDFQSSSSVRPRPSRGGIQSRRGMGSSGGSRVLRRNDLRSSLISKRTAPSVRSREYIKKIKQARLKMGESSFSKSKDVDADPQTPPKENENQAEQDGENEDGENEDFLDVHANDVNFEDDDDETAKRSSKAKSEEKDEKTNDDKEDADKTISDKNASGTSNSDERTRRARSEKSQSKEGERSVDLNCIHCMTKCSSLDVSFKTQSKHQMRCKLTMHFHRIIVIISRVVITRLP